MEKVKVNNSEKEVKSTLMTDLDLQRAYTADLVKTKGESAFTLVVTENFVEGMRDSGYKSTARSIDELVDNAIQAQADRVDIIATANYSDVNDMAGNRKKSKENERGSSITNIAVLDNGHGMDPDMIRAAVMWGGTHRHNDRMGFGRYGFGLPSAAVGMTRHYEVYSKVKGGNWYKVVVDLDDIVRGKFTDKEGRVIAPKAEKAKLPDFVSSYLEKQGVELESGTVILIVSPDRLTAGFRSTISFENKMLEEIGLTYRHILRRVTISINQRKVDPVDPLFLVPAARSYDVKNGVLAEALQSMSFDVKTSVGDKQGAIRIRFAYLPWGFWNENGDGGHGKELLQRFNVVKATEAILIVCRAGRQIDLVRKTNFAKADNLQLNNNARHWAVEIDFDPILDEEFGITVNKQQVGISERIYNILEDNGVAAIIKQLNSRYEKEANDHKKKDIDQEKVGGKRVSESIMEEAGKFKPAVEIPVIKEEESKDKVKKDAQEKAKITEKPVEVIIQQIVAETASSPYKVTFESLEGAPFYRAEYYGGQKRLCINTRHKFFSDVYAHSDTTVRLRIALELLLLVLGVAEAEASGEKEQFYKSERALWSLRLGEVLSLLDRKDPMENQEPTKAETGIVA